MMRKLMRRARRQRDSGRDKPEETPAIDSPTQPEAPNPPVHRRSYLRLPNFRTSVSFPNRRAARRGALSEINTRTSTRNLHHTSSARSADDVARAPIFYDTYDHLFAKNEVESEPVPATRVTMVESRAASPMPRGPRMDADGPKSMPFSQVRVFPNRESAPPSRRGSSRSNRIMNKRHHSLDRVMPRKAPMFNKSTTRVVPMSGPKPVPYKDRRRKVVPSTYHDVAEVVDDLADRTTNSSRDDLSFEPSSIESGQFARRSKTLMTEPVSSNVTSASTPRSFKRIDESPYSSKDRLQQNGAGPQAECKIYHAYTDILQKEARGKAGGLTVIVDLLRESDGNPIIIEKAALAIGILSENDPATRDVFGQHSAVQSLLQCLSMRLPSRHNKVKIMSTIVFAIACLLKESPRNVRLFETFDGPHKMGKVSASERYENCAAIPNNALKALSELKHHPSHIIDNNYNHVLTSSSSAARTIRYILRAMSLHDHRTDVQEHGLDALRTLVCRAEKGAFDDEILKLCAKATGTAFKMHSDSHEVQWQCLTLLCDLDDLRDGMFTLELDVESFFGSLRLIVNEAKMNGPRKPRLGKALLALIRRAVDVAVNNGWRTQDFKDAAVDAGAVETVLDVLDTYGHDAQLVDKICTILRVLLQSNEGRFRMNTVSSACAILSGIETVNARAAGILPT